MSQTNRTADICGACKNIVAAGCGTVRFWNGAARRYAPKYAQRSALGILSACHCTQCDAEHAKRRAVRAYNRKNGFV